MNSKMGQMTAHVARAASWAIALAGLALAPVTAQVRTIDPNTAIDADLAPPPPANSAPTAPGVDSSIYDGPPAIDAPATATGAPVTANSPPAAPDSSISYQDCLLYTSPSPRD